MRSLRVLWVLGFCLLAATSAFAQTPKAATPAPFEYYFPAIPPVPPMPAMPAFAPSAPFQIEGFLQGALSGQASTEVDPNVRFQQEVFRTLLRNAPDRALDLAAERLKADPADQVVLGS